MGQFSPITFPVKPTAQLVLADSKNQQHAIRFDILPTSVARRWAESLVFANRQSSIRENNRLYNFPHPELSAEDRIVASIDGCVRSINRKFPSLIPWTVDRADPQGSVNRIHTFFADTGHGGGHVTPELAPVWNELNNSLHAYESLIRSRELEKSGAGPAANAVVTWHDPIYQPLEGDDYKQFTVAKRFGTAYVNYCQIGRHIFELFLAGDDVAADEHVLPLRRLSADTYFWFGPTTGPKTLEKRERDIEEWFKKNETRFESLGFCWGDPGLAIGWVPVATIEGDFKTAEAQRALLGRLSGVERILSFDVEA